MVDAVVGLLVENLNSLMQREFSLVVGVKKDMDKLSSTLSTVRDVLEDAETKHLTEISVKNWLRRLKLAAYDASDALDEWATEAEQLQDEEHANAGSTNQVSCSVFSCFNFEKITFRRNMAKKIKEIISDFDEIAAQRYKFHLTPGVVQTASQFDQNRETISTPAGQKIYGRDGDMKNIIDVLLSNVSHEEVSICPIVGIGGLGKTTLAQLVYNDDRVVNSFELRIWVCVSDPFDIKGILKAIVESSCGFPCDLENLQSIQSKIREILKEKRYLLVLDDVWNENREQWNRLVSFLVGGAKGSSIIVTTRLETVASITGTVPKYCLEALANDDCWSLFKNSAFGVGSEEHPNLVAIGKEIVNKCKGVPLAVKSLGSLLWLKTEENEWRFVRDSDIWSLEEGEENVILPALRLSYNHLPPQWRQCFAYCSIFPKDFIMEKDELIRLWIANDFIQSNEKMDLEETGDGIFRELFRRSFFENKEEIRVGYPETCKMHDLMHDLACSVAADECLITTVQGVQDVPKSVRYLSIIGEEVESLPHPFTSQAPLRTLLFMTGHTFLFTWNSFSNLRYLRALSLRGMDIDTLLPSIGMLEHLRYLNLSSTNITSLPETIHRLRNLLMLNLSSNRGITTLAPIVGNLNKLRYLNISSCSLITLPESIVNLKDLWGLDLSGNDTMHTLPASIGKLENLRYLNLCSCDDIRSLPECIGGLKNLQFLGISTCFVFDELPKSITKLTCLRYLLGEIINLPVGIGQLTCLQTLGIFRVGMPGSDSGCRISELQRLNQLRGKLEIWGLENVRSFEEFQEANLASKKYLTSLELKWGDPSNVDSSEESNYKELIQGFQLPPNIQGLAITGCDSISCFPTKGIQGLKSSLVKLEFDRCDHLKSLSEWLPYLTSLKTLEINKCPELIFSEEDFQPLGSLVRLFINDMPKLTGFPNGIKCLTMLQSLEIYRCPDFKTFNGLQHLTNLEVLYLHSCHPDLNQKFDSDEWDEEWEYVGHIPEFDLR